MNTSTPNIDTDEVSKFNTDSNAWWDPEGEFKTLHHINPARLKFIKEHIDLQGKTILDVGCGGGILSESLHKSGAKVTGIDAGEHVLAVAKPHAEKRDYAIDYQQTTIEDYAEAHPQEFDVVTCMEMLEHVPDPKAILEAISATVKPGGLVFLSTLNRTWQAYLFAIIGAEYVLGILPKKTHDYAKFLKPSELDAWARQANLETIKLSGMQYNPLSGEASLNENISVNYLMACKKRAND